jgi:subtilisin family serine protease
MTRTDRGDGTRGPQGDVRPLAEASGGPVRAASRARVRPLAAAVLAVGFAAHGSSALAASASQQSLEPTYTYQGSTRALTIDPTGFVVQHSFPEAHLVELVLDKFSVDATVTPWHVAGTAWVALPPSLRTTRDVVELVNAIGWEQGVTFASPRFVDARGDALVATKDLLVAFEPGVGAVLAEQLLVPYGEVLQHEPAGLEDTYLVRTEFVDGFGVLAAAEALASLPETRWCDLDFQLEVRLDQVPNDPLYPSQWSLRNTGQLGGPGGYDLDAPAAWAVTTGVDTVVVGVLDDGVQQDHPDIMQVPGVDFTGSGSSGGPATACDRHGTAVAGCIAAGMNNGLGTTGVAPGVRVQSLKVFTTTTVCNGQGAFQVSWFLNALEHCRTNDVRVTNTSLGFAPVTSITQKFDSTRAAGIVHFASAGNSAGAIGYPAEVASVNAVGSIDPDGDRSAFSCFGPALAFAAPGQTVWTTDRTGADGFAGADYTTLSGTSFASPFVAGVAALVLSVDPALTAAEVESALATTAMDLGPLGRDDDFGYGLVRAGGAVQWTQSGLAAKFAPTIAALDPSAVPVLAPDASGTLTILGTNLTNVSGVRLGGTTLPYADVTIVDDGQIDVRYTRLPSLGLVDVELIHAGGSVLSTVNSIVVASPTIDLTDSGSVGLDRSAGVELFVASSSYDFYYLIGSLVHQPTLVPGIIDSDLGGGDMAQLHLLAMGSIPPDLGHARQLVSILNLPLGLDLHFQAGIVEFAAPALPLITTGVQSGTISF